MRLILKTNIYIFGSSTCLYTTELHPFAIVPPTPEGVQHVPLDHPFLSPTYTHCALPPERPFEGGACPREN